eukprot:3338394-Heterocapsa_arctica.AAC.1
MLRKLDANSPNDAGTLRNILAGGTWPQVRVAEVDKAASKICPCCREGEEDEYHRWYRCGSPELNHVEGPEERQAPLREHLWNRGPPQMGEMGKPLGHDDSPTTKFRGA